MGDIGKCLIIKCTLRCIKAVSSGLLPESPLPVYQLGEWGPMLIRETACRQLRPAWSLHLFLQWRIKPPSLARLIQSAVQLMIREHQRRMNQLLQWRQMSNRQWISRWQLMIKIIMQFQITMSRIRLLQKILNQQLQAHQILIQWSKVKPVRCQ